ncbi:MAG: hypothetical protein AAGJ78_04425 [Pseudomonadota bacterium]
MEIPWAITKGSSFNSDSKPLTQYDQQLVVKTTVSDSAALFSVVASGYGDSLVPGLAFPDDWQQLVTRQPVLPTLTCSLRLMCAKQQTSNDAIQVLVEEIRSAALDKKPK